MKEITLLKKKYHYQLRIYLTMILLIAVINMTMRFRSARDASDVLIIATFIIFYIICIFLLFNFIGSKRVVTYNFETKEIIVINTNKNQINGGKVKFLQNEITAIKVIPLTDYLINYRQDLTYDIKAKEKTKALVSIGVIEFKNKRTIVIVEGNNNFVLTKMNKIKKNLQEN